MEIISHRGGAKEKTENSKESILYSLDLPIHGIEIDINFSEDNIPYIIHDFFIKDTILENVHSEIINLNFPNLLSLKEVLDLIQGKKKVFFEIKGIYTEEKMEIINYLLTNYGEEYNYDFYIASFNTEFLLNANHKIKKMFITNNIFDINLFEIIYNKIKFDALSFNYFYIPKEILYLCFTKNISTYAWTLNNPIFFNKFNDLAEENLITGIITDFPSKFYYILNPDLKPIKIIKKEDEKNVIYFNKKIFFDENIIKTEKSKKVTKKITKKFTKKVSNKKNNKKNIIKAKIKII
jgi:glycerophosphoryl diester phosphodiesterase